LKRARAGPRLFYDGSSAHAALTAADVAAIAVPEPSRGALLAAVLAFLLLLGRHRARRVASDIKN